MATVCAVQDIITQAYLNLTIIDEITPPSAEQMNKGLILLNDAMLHWDKDGIRFGWWPQTVLSALAPIQDEDVRNAKLLFTGELARAYGIDLASERPDLVKDIDTAMVSQSKRSIEYLETDLTGLPFAQGGLFGPGRV